MTDSTMQVVLKKYLMNCRVEDMKICLKKKILISFFTLKAIGLAKNICKIVIKSTFQVVLSPLN